MTPPTEQLDCNREPCQNLAADFRGGQRTRSFSSSPPPTTRRARSVTDRTALYPHTSGWRLCHGGPWKPCRGSLDLGSREFSLTSVDNARPHPFRVDV